MKIPLETKLYAGIITIISIVLIAIFWVLPNYRVYSQRLKGMAELERAKYSKLAMVEDARARLESSTLDAKAEVERAKGMAEAMEIEGGMLTPVYNQYLFIRTLEEIAEQGNLPQIIYVPSDGMVPVMDLKSDGE